MSDTLSGTGCGVRCPICKNGLIVVLLILLGSATTGWVVTATRDRPVVSPPAPATPTIMTPVLPAVPPVDRPSVPAPEMVEVLVAAKNLPVGTVLTREDLKHDKVVKTKKVPKDGLPPALVGNRDELVDKRLARALRADETFTPQDLVKGAVITLPDGYDMVSLPVGHSQAAAGFVVPGNRVNILATMRSGNRLYAFTLLVNLLVLSVDTYATAGKDVLVPVPDLVSVAVTEKEALLLVLAKAHGCSLELMLRHPSKTAESDKDYDINKVIKLLTKENEPPVTGEGKVEPKEQPAPEGPQALSIEVAPAPRRVEFAPAPRSPAVPIPPAGE
jgi:pilus assembly protein CpaB